MIGFDPSSWGWPQWTYFILTLAGLMLVSINHGKEKDERYNAFSSIVSNVIVLFILICGGFYA